MSIRQSEGRGNPGERALIIVDGEFEPVAPREGVALRIWALDPIGGAPEDLVTVFFDSEERVEVPVPPVTWALPSAITKTVDPSR